jgi:hypothetical protein
MQECRAKGDFVVDYFATGVAHCKAAENIDPQTMVE